jgi:carbonic anhydrase
LFSVDSYTVDFSPRQQSIIDNFFDQLKWEDTSSPTVDKISYSQLMDLVDFSNRFVYQGSWTTPPCTTLIYWNVLSTVYPISQKHLDQFKQQLDSGESGLSKTGNWRSLQKIDD